MTLIEFFEKDAVENICSSLTKAPDRVILIGDKSKLMQKHAENYRKILSSRGMDVEFICRVINKNNMHTIIEALSMFVEEYDDCVFDLTGGEDLYLVAVGIVSERYKEKNIQMHRFNIRNNTIIDCDEDGNTILEGKAPVLSVEENIRVYGGDVVYEENRKGTTYRWDMTPDFITDIHAMWDICRADPYGWNSQIGVFAIAEQLCGADDEELTITVPVAELKDRLDNVCGKLVDLWKIIKPLMQSGLLKKYKCDDDVLSVKFKNKQVKYCLTVAGQALEMKVFLAALDAREKDGSKTYNDVMNGVFIDWDGDIGADRQSYDTENEIDVVMMHGMVPVFVSCKNGYIDKDELYKLNAVATRFGGKYAKKVLIATSLDDSDSSNHIRQRAEDMGIRLVEGYSHNGQYIDLVDMDDEDLNRLVRSLWSN